jgi:hypothetical protein
MLIGTGIFTLNAALPEPRGSSQVSGVPGLGVILALGFLGVGYIMTIGYRGWRLLLLGPVLIANTLMLVPVVNEVMVAIVMGFYLQDPAGQARARQHWDHLGLILIAWGLANLCIVAVFVTLAWRLERRRPRQGER